VVPDHPIGVPLPTVLVEILREHLAGEVGEGPDALLFTTPSGAQLNPVHLPPRRVAGRPHCGVPGRQPVARDPPARPAALGHHGLAQRRCSPEDVQSWSGHKTASVVLDTYLGVLRGDESLGRTRFEAALSAAVGSDPVTGS